MYGRVILDDEEKNKKTLVGPAYAVGTRDIEAQGVSKWTGMSCSFWYEWSLVCRTSTPIQTYLPTHQHENH